MAKCAECGEEVISLYFDLCSLCSDDVSDHVECWQCGGEGFSHHDCGEDTCYCLHPYDNVVCDICDGKGGWPKPTTKKEARP